VQGVSCKIGFIRIVKNRKREYKMFELGNIQNKDYNRFVAPTEHNRISNLQKTKASIKIDNTNKTGPLFENSLNTEIAKIWHSGQNNNNIFSSDNSPNETIAGFREKVTAFRLLADEILNSRHSTRDFIKNLQVYIEEIMKNSDDAGYIIYDDVGKMLKTIRDEIQAINSSEAQKALRCQANINPDRALKLLIN
jgi:hypothetical protein